MRSLGSRLTIWYVLVVMTTVGGAVLLGRWLLIRQMMRGVDLLNAAEFQEIPMRSGADPHDLTEAQWLSDVEFEAKLDAALYLFQVRRADGTILFRSENMGDGKLLPNPPGQKNWTSYCDEVGPVRVAEFVQGPLVVQLASPLRSVDRLFRSYFEVGCIVLGVVFVVSFFLGIWLKRLALDPIRRIEKTASHITADNLSERIPVGAGNDEVTDLARLLNRMFDRLEKSFFQLWRFAGNASHELKTPLSIIRLQSEKLLTQGNLSGAQQDAVQQQLESIARLSTVIDKLLFLARSEVGAIHLNLKAQSTAALIRGFIEDAAVLCEERKVELVIAKNDEIDATFDAALIRQVFFNLLGNALRVTPAGGQIILSSSNEMQKWRATIEDTGPGLPQDLLEEVFEPFIRAHDPSQAQGADGNCDGAGLGLAICRSILLLHHGTIRASNRNPEPGLRVYFEIPCGQPIQQSTPPAWDKSPTAARQSGVSQTAIG